MDSVECNGCGKSNEVVFCEVCLQDLQEQLVSAEDAMKDLEWIDALPGQKLMIKGNHDYWWPSNAKL